MSVSPPTGTQKIIDINQIRGLTEINGVSIREIEKRARPGAYAVSGFLGATESFGAVLKADWTAVQNLGTTHAKNAKALNDIWQFRKTNPGANILYNDSTGTIKAGTMDDCVRECKKLSILLTIAILAGSIAGAALGHPYALLGLIPAAILICRLWIAKRDGFQPLRVEILTSRGGQESIFGDRPGRENNWGREMWVTNLSNNVHIKVASGVIDYIEDFGFYEGGGEQNKYRVDPAKLHSILTGKSLAETQAQASRPSVSTQSLSTSYV